MHIKHKKMLYILKVVCQCNLSQGSTVFHTLEIVLALFKFLPSSCVLCRSIKITRICQIFFLYVTKINFIIISWFRKLIKIELLFFDPGVGKIKMTFFLFQVIFPKWNYFIKFFRGRRQVPLSSPCEHPWSELKFFLLYN